MKGRLTFWIIASPLLCISGLLVLVFLSLLLNAPHLASQAQQDRMSLLKRAEFVDHYLIAHGRLPSKEEFMTASSQFDDRPIEEYELYASRPQRGEGFKFADWPEGKPNFAVSYWAGDWWEFYDSNSRTTSLDAGSRVSTWVAEALCFLGVSVLFAASPFIARWLWRRRL